MFGQGLLKGLKITLKHHFQKDITIQYPEEMPFLQKRFRGHLVFEFEKCIACGICVKNCPNNVLSLEEVRDENTKKKKLVRYTIDHQYCMFCNLCVENCPKNCLYFNHDFELSQYNRDEIKTVYNRPPHMDEEPQVQANADSVENEDKTKNEDKEAKQLAALRTGFQRNPAKVVGRLLEDEDQIAILVEILQADENKASKLLEMMVKDKEKAQKVAGAFVKKGMAAGKQPEGGESK